MRLTRTTQDAMQYSRYFKTGQKIILRSKEEGTSSGRLDSLTVYFYDYKADHFRVLLPYGSSAEEQYPFTPGMPFELLSDAFGLGLRLSGEFESQIREDMIRIQVKHDLEVLQRRLHRRLDIPVGLRLTRGKGSLRSFREQWDRNVRILQAGRDTEKLSRFPRTQVNLSAGGIRFSIKAPVEIADLCLLLIDLFEGPPICALAEVVWFDENEVNGRHSAGLRFTHILEIDQRRIEAFIVQRAAEMDREPEQGLD